MAKNKKRKINQTGKQSTPRAADDASTAQPPLEIDAVLEAPVVPATAPDVVAPRSVFNGWRPWCILAAFCVGIYFNQLGSWVLIDPGETYYTEAAREMVESGEYIVPHLNYQIYFSKPILTFWMIAASYKMFGLTPLAARLPFALLASLLVLFTYYVTKKIANAKAALIAGLMAVAAPLIMFVSKTSCIDMAFTAFLNFALFATALAAFNRNKHWWIVIWLALGLAVLTKGPAAIILFALGSVAFFILERPSPKQAWVWIKRTKPLFGVPLFLLTFMPWFYLVYKATKGLFVQVFIEYENLARLSGKTNLVKSNVLHFIPVLGYGIAPWFLLLPQALKQSFFGTINEKWWGSRFNFKSSYRPYNKDRQPVVRDITAEHDAIEVERLSLFLFSSWSLAVLVFFSLSKTQLDTYILPIVAPLAVTLGVVSTRLCDKWLDKSKPDPQKWDKFWLHAVLGLVSGLSLAAGIALIWASVVPTYKHIDLTLVACGVITIAAAAWQILAIKNKDWLAALLRGTLTLALLTALVHPLGFRYMTEAQQNHMVYLARDLQGAPEEIAVLGTYRPSAISYIGAPVEFISDIQSCTKVDRVPDDGLSWGPTPGGKRQFILTDDKHAGLFKTRPELKFVELRRSGHWACYELTNGYVPKHRSLEEIFKLMIHNKLKLDAANNFGPLTVPLGGGDAEWYKVRTHKADK